MYTTDTEDDNHNDNNSNHMFDDKNDDDNIREDDILSIWSFGSFPFRLGALGSYEDLPPKLGG